VPQAEQETRQMREGRFSRHLRLVRAVVKEPRQILPLAREWLLDVWRSRGGGFYGLGYLIAFCWLQVSLLFGDLSESSSLGEFAIAAALEYVLRFSLMAFVNVFLALLWPVYILEWFGGAGFILFGLGYVAFEYALRPLTEQLFPELRDPVSPNLEQ
jgi:hypothetical protein